MKLNMLLMQAISRKRNNAIPLLIPTEKNIKRAFEGCDDFTTSVANIVKNQLVAQYKILFASPMENGEDAFVTAAIEGDQAKIDEIIDRLKTETTTSKLMKDGKLDTAFTWTPALRMRFDFTFVTTDDFTKQLGKAAEETDGWKMKALVCIARNEKEQTRIRELIATARVDESKREVVIIDATPNLMGQDRFDEWAKFAGNEEYWRPKDPDLADNKKDNADAQLTSWRESIEEGNFYVYYRGTEKKSCSMAQLKSEVLPAAVLERFPLSFDNVQASSQFFDANNLPSGAKCGITETAGGIFQSATLTAILKDAWKIPEYWTKPANGALPISQLKKEVDKLILGKFEAGEIRISQLEIFRFLMGLGFAPINLYAFLTGFLLKEYNSEKYRYGIGDTGEGGDCLSSGEALWLWNQEDGEEELRKLILEYSIVAESNRFAGNNTFEKATTFNACISAWRNCARYTHIPYVMLKEQRPELKEWLSIIKEIHTDDSLITEEKRQKFLNQFETNHDAIEDFLVNRQAIFSMVCSSELSGLSADEISTLYVKLQTNTFSDTSSDFMKNVQASAAKIKAEQKKHKLFALWQSLSGYSGTPMEWSDEKKTPILALVAINEADSARRTFDTLNSSSPSAVDIDYAEEYLNSSPSFLNVMKTQTGIDAAFSRQFIGNYSAFISVQEAREELCSLPTDAYYWMTGTQAIDTVRNKAKNNYFSGGNAKIVEMVSEMNADDAKERLLKLVQNYADVGIRMINDEE